MEETISLTVNGKDVSISTDPRRTLLDVLREDMQLTGTKYGCGEGQCGACTVIIDDKLALACLTTIRRAAGKSITTIEGLANGENLHPIQEAFLAEAAMQCGYCTPGMILRTKVLLEEVPDPADEVIRERLNGNLCRCNHYPRIEAAVKQAAEAMRKGGA